MKKQISLLLAVALCLGMCACGSSATENSSALSEASVTVSNAEVSEAVQTVIDAIDAIGEVTTESGTLIETAENYYNILTDAEKEQVSNRFALVEARDAFDNLSENNTGTVSESANEPELSTSEPFSDVNSDYSVQLPVYALESFENLDGDKLAYSDFVVDDSGYIVSYNFEGDALTSTYDENGLEIGYTEEDMIQSNEYDENGNKIKTVNTYTDDKGGISTWNYTYYDNGMPRTMICSLRDGDVYTDDYTYETDENGRIITFTDTDEEGYKIVRNFTYDVYGNMNSSRIRKYRSSGENSRDDTYPVEFDALGHMVIADEFTFTYAIAGYRSESCQNMEGLTSPENWVTIEENLSVPAPDSVFSCFTEVASDQANNTYSYQISTDPVDPVAMYNCYRSTAVQAQSIHPEVIEAFNVYKSVLKDVLGYSITDIDDATYFVQVGDISFNVALVYEEGTYSMEIALP